MEKPLQTVNFTAPELNRDGSFTFSRFTYEGKDDEWWKLYRIERGEKKLFLELGEGYRLVKSLICGVCSTDLALNRMTFPLPLISGHEVVGESNGERVCMDINATHRTRGILSDCPYCKSAPFHTQCPERITLGIDRLPGGFSEWLLVPRNALVPIGTLPISGAVLTEPLAAARWPKGVTMTPPHDVVGVLGAGRLGLLHIVALREQYEKQRQQQVQIGDAIKSIIAIVRSSAQRKRRPGISIDLGADQELCGITMKNESCDTAFECTGNPEGFFEAMRLSKRIVHVKSTHGLPTCGLNITPLVVDELRIVRFRELPKCCVCACGCVPCRFKTEKNPPYCLGKMNFISNCKDREFDFGVACSLEGINTLIRPKLPTAFSLVRPRGTIFYDPGDNTDPFSLFIKKGKELWSSRCGNISETKDFLENMYKTDRRQYDKLIGTFITKHETLDQIERAFTEARNPEHLKVVIDIACE